MSAPDAVVVRSICQRATAHNFGQTVWEITPTPDGLLVRMSSWPRGQEALRALRDAGYTADADDDCCVLVAAGPVS